MNWYKQANNLWDKLKNQPGIYWHGSPSGDMRGGPNGLHVGTFQAAKEALEARIGIPVEGEWDGTREYGKTLLVGQNRLKNDPQYKWRNTGYNCEAPDEDYYPNGKAYFGDGTFIPLDAKPIIFPLKITGKMTNSPNYPHEDFRANGLMKGQISRGKARNGYYYRNVGEDSGSISAVVPNGSHIQRVE